MYEKWSCISCVTGEFYISNRIRLYSLSTPVKQHTREHITVLEARTVREDFSSLPTFFPSAIRDRVTWLWNLSKERAPWFLERRLRRKVYAKYLRIFATPRFLLRFWASCYYLDNIVLTQPSRCQIFQESYEILKCEATQNVCYQIDNKCLE